jgi:Cu-processing system permease protein
MNGIWMLARLTLRECIRRKVFLIVPIVTAAFLILYAVGAHYAFRASNGVTNQGPGNDLVDADALAGTTLLGLSIFVTLFLGAVIGVFLTFTTVRGDGEQGLLAPIAVRPIGRASLVAGRLLGAGLVSVAYVTFLYGSSVLITGVIGAWWPDPVLLPALELALGVLIVVVLSMLGSVFLSTIANGIMIMMVYGAGLLAGLLGQLGAVLSSSTLESIGRVASWILPFEALYQAALHDLTADTRGLTRVVVQLGPLGGAQEGGSGLFVWASAYVVLLGWATVAFLARRDL